jgi:hypoxanthine-DNA glycosylase
VHTGVGIVHGRKAHRPLDPQQQVEVDARLLADLPRRDVGAVVADQTSRRQQHRRERTADLVDGDTALLQPRDQLGAFGPRRLVQTVEQPGRFDVLVGHQVKVYRAMIEVMSTQSSPQLYGFAPILGDDARVLVLGNAPSVLSLAAHQYYGNPRNAFWRIAGEIVGVDADAPYDARTAALRAHGIAVWDVLRSCRRKGSLDSAIERNSMVVNDFERLFSEHPSIERVLFNGAAAEQNYRRLAGEPPRPHVRLPSTSPAQTMRFEDKLAAWRAAFDAALT